MQAQSVRLFGVGMLTVTVVALWLNITLLTVEQDSPVLTALLGLFVGVDSSRSRTVVNGDSQCEVAAVGGYIVGEMEGGDDA